MTLPMPSIDDPIYNLFQSHPPEEPRIEGKQRVLHISPYNQYTNIPKIEVHQIDKLDKSKHNMLQLEPLPSSLDQSPPQIDFTE